MDSKTQPKNNPQYPQYNKIVLAAKNCFFSFNYLILKDFQGSIYFIVLGISIQYIQLHFYIFHPTMKKVWNASSVTDKLNYIFGLFLITPYFEGQSLDAYVAVLFIIFVFLLITIAMAIYVAYQYKQNNVIKTIPVLILRFIIQLLTLFYMPLLEFFAQSWNCDLQGFHKVLEASCWNQMHFFVVIIAIFSIVLFCLLNGLCVITFYECRSSQNSMSKVNARSNFLFLVYQTVLVLSFSVLNSEDFVYILIGLILGGSLMVFLSFILTDTYHHQGIQSYCNVMAAINLWSAIMLCASKLMEGQVYEGSAVAWIIGVPFNGLIILTRRNKQIERLIMNINKMVNAEEIMCQIRYLLQLLRSQPSDKYSTILLDGYIEVHKQNCNLDNCPFKAKLSKISRITRTIMSVNDVTERYANLLQLLYIMFLKGVKKFPNNNDLRLAFAFFLLDKMKYKQQALQEMYLAEQFRPSFDIQSIIFRYKRIIETEIHESRSGDFAGGLEILPSSAVPPLISSFALAIETSALQQMEFWSQLCEDIPDLGKLGQLGTKSIIGIDEVEGKWAKLQKVSPYHKSSTLLYSRYLMEILNDDQLGGVLLEKLRGNAQTISNWEEDSTQDFSNDPLAKFIVSCDFEHFGQIMNMNQAGASLLHYHKSEILNQKIQIIMPHIYAKYHDQIVENYLNQIEIKAQIKDRMVFIKNKMGYISPAIVSIQMVNSIFHGIQLIGSIMVERQYKPIVHILVDDTGRFEGISQTCISLLRIDLKYIMNKKHISDVLPGVFENKEDYMNKIGCLYQYQVPHDIQHTQERVQFPSRLSINTFNDPKKQFIISIQDIALTTVNNVIGYIIRLESYQEPLTNISRLMPMVDQQFYFSFKNDNQMSFVGGFADYFDQSSQNNTKVENLMDLTEKLPVTIEDECINYGQGIKTLRLFEGRIGEIEDLESEADDQDDEIEQLNGQMEYVADESASVSDRLIFKSRSNLITMMKNQKIPTAVRNLKIVSNSLMICIMILAFVEFFMNKQEIQNVQDTIYLLHMSNNLRGDFQQVYANVIDLQFIQMGFLDPSEEQGLKDNLRLSLTNIESEINQIQLNSLTLSGEQQRLYQGAVIGISFDSQTIRKYGFIEATQQMIAKSFQILNAQIPQTQDVYFVLQNGLNTYLEAQNMASSYYVHILLEQTSDNRGQFSVIVIVVGVLLIISMFVLMTVLLSSRYMKEEVLKQFMLVPEDVIKQLFDKCEVFVSSLLDVGDDIIEIPENEIETLIQQAPLQKKKSRKFNITPSTQYGLWAQLSLGSLIIIGYFIMNFQENSNFQQNLRQLIPEANATSFAEGYYGLAGNTLRIFIYNDGVVLGQKAYEQSIKSLDLMYQLDSFIQQQHSDNVHIHSMVFNDAFNKIMMHNPCNLFPLLTECDTFADGSIKQGLAVALTRYFENIRYLLSLQIDKLELLKLKEAIESRIMMKDYFINDFRYLNQKFKLSIQFQWDEFLTERVSLFILFLSFLVLVYFTFWTPLAKEMALDIWRTRTQLAMIPVKFLIKIPSISKQLQNY